MSTIKIIAGFNDQCGEGPLWHPRDRILYWIDIVGRRFSRCSWPEGRCDILREGISVGGFAFSASGFVLVNSSGVWEWNGSDSLRLIADTAAERHCALNDCIADPEGRLFTGSTFYSDDRDDYEPGCLFRVDADASIHIVDDGFGLSNGLGFSPDCRTLYFADSAERVIYAYDYRQSDGSIRNRRTFVKVPADEGIPDGLTVDAGGFVWVAQWFGSRVVRYDPDGKTERTIQTPAAQTSSIAFGGPELTDLFITSAGVSAALPLAPPGYSPRRGHIGGELYHLNLGIAGKPEYTARIGGRGSVSEGSEI